LALVIASCKLALMPPSTFMMFLQVEIDSHSQKRLIAN
jgi:hypothetical protein